MCVYVRVCEWDPVLFFLWRGFGCVFACVLVTSCVCLAPFEVERSIFLFLCVNGGLGVSFCAFSWVFVPSILPHLPPSEASTLRHLANFYSPTPLPPLLHVLPFAAPPPVTQPLFLYVVSSSTPPPVAAPRTNTHSPSPVVGNICGPIPPPDPPHRLVVCGAV